MDLNFFGSEGTSKFYSKNNIDIKSLSTTNIFELIKENRIWFSYKYIYA